MKFPSLFRLFGKDQSQGSAGRKARRQGASSAERARRTRLHLDHLEDRTLLATIPAPYLLNTPQGFGGGNSPSIAIDPTNPLKAVIVWATNNPANNFIGSRYTIDGGQTWFTGGIDVAGKKLIDPRFPVRTAFAQQTDPSAAFDRNGNVYVVRLEHGDDAQNIYRTSGGAIAIEKYNFSGAAPIKVLLPNEQIGFFGGPSGVVLRQWCWLDCPSSYTPIVAVDDTLPAYTDPDDPSKTITNPASGTVYVAWGSDERPRAQPTNVYRIRVAASSDGGLSFGPGVFPTRDITLGATTWTRPRLVVSQGTPSRQDPLRQRDATVRPGQVTIAWEDFGSSQVRQSTLSAGVGLGFTGDRGTILPGLPGMPAHTPQTSTFDTVVNLAGPNFAVVNQVAAKLCIEHPDVATINAILVAPDGTRVTLFRNRTNAAGQQIPGQGLQGQNLGFSNGVCVGTVFDDLVPTPITDPAAVAPYLGTYQPEILPGLSRFRGQTGTALSGRWQLLVTDNRDRPQQALVRGFEINFSSGFQTVYLANNTPVFATGLPTTNNPVDAIANSPAINPRGIRPAVSLATDNTLGSFSPYQGRIYMAYTTLVNAFGPGTDDDNTDVVVVTTDDGGVYGASSWSAPVTINDDDAYRDGFSEASRQSGRGRAQFMPEISVDQATGTLVATWRDGRDASLRDRMATYIAASIDGGATFSAQTDSSFSPRVITRDAVTGRDVVLEPVLEGPGAGPFFAGDRMGVAVAEGRIYAIWSGNGGITLNQARVTLGPRIIASSMGPIVSTLTTPAGPFNNTFSNDGTRKPDAFIVQFDRPVDPASFKADLVTLIYRNASIPASAPGIRLEVNNVIPLDAGLFGPVARAPGATRFLVLFDPTQAFLQFGTYTGTYSYAIQPLVVDRIRSGNPIPVTRNIRRFSKVEQPALPVPTTGTGGTGTSRDFTRSQIVVATGDTDVITKLTVTVDIRHALISDLVLTLVAPDGSRVPLAIRRPGIGTGTAFPNTVFDDDAVLDIATALPPFIGSYKPDGRLRSLIGRNPNGLWTLEVEDQSPGNTGQLASWSMEIATGILNSNQSGNAVDQNADGVRAQTDCETQGPQLSPLSRCDVYAVPRPINSIPFIVPYDNATLPMIVPGPFVVWSRVVGGRSPSDVLNETATSLDVEFDRDINPATFTPSRILRIYGPTGDLVGPFTVSPNPAGTPQDKAARVFRITFPLQNISGPYTVSLTAGILAANGQAVPGPFLVGAQVVVNGSASAVDVVFDRDIDPASFTPVQVLRIVGPIGQITGPFTVTANPPGTPGSEAARTFRIGFPTQQVSGTYVITLGASIRSTRGEALDTNLNAALDVTRDYAPPGSVTQTLNFPSSNVPVNILPQSTVVSKLTIPTNFLVQGAKVQLNITFPNDPDLTATLIAPDGTRILLFNQVGFSGNRANFTSTTFDDDASTPITRGDAPFFGTFNAQQRLRTLVDRRVAAGGSWTLEIVNRSTTLRGTLNSWNLTLQRPIPTSGLGEENADQASADFSLFSFSAVSQVAKTSWTAIGPAGIDTVLRDPFDPTKPVRPSVVAGRLAAVAVDPSDPSGNTVFVSAPGGGIWRTSNFLTREAEGPTYVPLTDFGPNFSLNVGSIAVYGRNKDPRQSVLFAATGDGDSAYWYPEREVIQPTYRGVGFLRSLDGGATWTVLDSTTNVDAAGQPLAINRRDRLFVGATVLKVVADPKPTVSGDIIVYAAVSDITAADRAANRAGGIWRSLNGGNTWQRMRPGQATDLILSPASVSDNTGQLQVLFGAFEGEGVFLSSNQGVLWNLMTGTAGNPLIRAYNSSPAETIPVIPGQNPNGARGRITLAVPALTGEKVLNTVYAGWVYALVATAATRNAAGTPTGGGDFDGLYVTKDFGQNWTRIRIAGKDARVNAADPFRPPAAPPTNDTREADNNLFRSSGDLPWGNFSQSMVVDPNDPNIIYIGGADGESKQTTNRSRDRLMRIDLSRLYDPHHWNLLGVGGQTNPDRQGPALGVGDPTRTPTSPLPGYGRHCFTGSVEVVCPNVADPNSNIYQRVFHNLLRDPDNIFDRDATLLFDVLRDQNGVIISRFLNQGYGARWTSFVDILEDAVDIHQATAIRDPLSGKTRLLFATDQGIYSGIDSGDGRLLRGVGGVSEPDAFSPDTPFATGSRNGNLQIAHLFQGAGQPSVLASAIANSLFYGAAFGVGVPKSEASILQTGNLRWRGPVGNAQSVATDQTGTGASYQFVWAESALGTNFFQVNEVGSDPTAFGIGRTFGLLQQNRPFNPPNIKVPDPQWQLVPGNKFASNPISPDQLVIGSFGTETLEGGAAVAAGGKVFRTRNRGLTWFQIGNTGDLDGTRPQAFAYGAPNPVPPNQPAGNLDDFIYAGTYGGRVFVTFTGGGGAAGTAWKNISAGLDGSPLQAIAANPFRGSKEAYALTLRGVYYMADSTVANPSWQRIDGNLYSIRHAPNGDQSQAEPLLRLGETDLLALAVDWRYQVGAAAARKVPVLYVGGQGGVFRSADAGKTWRRFPDTGDGATVDGGYLPVARITDLDLVVGNLDPTTGKADESTGLNTLVASSFGRGAWAIRLPELPGKTHFPGPRVVSVDPMRPTTSGFAAITLQFASAVDPDVFTLGTIRSFVGPIGTITPLTIEEILPQQSGDPPRFTRYRITFAPLRTDGVYTLVLGPQVTDFSGNAMNQNNNTVNGEEPNDRYTVRFVINTSDNGKFITGLFNEVLKRPSETDGFLNFIDVVDAARAQALGPIARMFVASAEGRAQFIRTYYQSSSPTVIGNFLRRPAAQPEVNAWVSFLQAGGTPNEMANYIVSSVEYYQKAGGSNLGFLTQMYVDLLGRGLDTAGRDSFLLLLDQAATEARRGVADLLNHSGEYYGNLVRGYYTKYLGRAAGASDVSFWTGQLASGTPAERVVATLTGSGEYYSNKGSNNGRWVDAAYVDILGRAADAPSRATLVDQLNNGAAREDVAFGLANSDEYHGNLIRGYYTKYLGRTASPGDVALWNGLFRAGLSDEAVISSIMASQEYLAKAGGTNQGFVDKAYLDVLGRAADPAGRTASLLYLAQTQGNARYSVANVFTTSTEYYTRVITTNYQTYLRRGPGLSEINLWLPLLRSPASGTPGSVSPQEQFVGQLFSSGEYFQQNGNTNQSWVASLYTTLLKRAGSPGEINAITGQVLNFYADQRFGVGETFYTSAESRRTLIVNSYNSLLRRLPLDQEVDSWLTAFQGGLREEQMFNAMVASDEYYQRRASSNPTEWVNKVYEDLLGRPRGANENFLLTPAPTNVVLRTQAANVVLTSQEYRRKVVEAFYRTYLGREGTLPEVDVMVGHLNQGARFSQVVASLLASGEYFQRTHQYP